MKKVRAPDNIYYLQTPNDILWALGNFVLGHFTPKGELILNRLPRTSNCRDSILKEMHIKFSEMNNVNDSLDLFLVFNSAAARQGNQSRTNNNILPRWKIMSKLKGLITAQWLSYTFKTKKSVLYVPSSYCEKFSTERGIKYTTYTFDIIHLNIKRSAYMSPIFSWLLTQFIRVKFTKLSSSNLSAHGEWGKVLKLCVNGIRSGKIFKKVPCITPYTHITNKTYTYASGPMGFVRTFLPSCLFNIFDYESSLTLGNILTDKIVIRAGYWVSTRHKAAVQFKIKDYNKPTGYEKVFSNVHLHLFKYKFKRIAKMNIGYCKIIEHYINKKDPKYLTQHYDSWQSRTVDTYTYTLTKTEKEKVNALIKQFHRD